MDALRQAQGCGDDESVSMGPSTLRHPNPNPSSSKAKLIVILNLFQDNRRRLLVMLKQVQHDDMGGGCVKNNFPTNNHIGYSSRVMQAAV